MKYFITTSGGLPSISAIEIQTKLSKEWEVAIEKVSQGRVLFASSAPPAELYHLSSVERVFISVCPPSFERPRECEVFGSVDSVVDHLSQFNWSSSIRLYCFFFLCVLVITSGDRWKQYCASPERPNDPFCDESPIKFRLSIKVSGKLKLFSSGPEISQHFSPVLVDLCSKVFST